MMGGFLVLMSNLVGLVALVASIWLVVRGFRRSAGWGLALLFLSPFSTLIFGFKHWQEEKRPFLLWLGSCVAAVFLIVALFGHLGGFAMISMAQEMDSGNVTEEDARRFMEQTVDRWEQSGVFDEEDRAKLREMKQALNEGFDESAASALPAFPGSSSGGAPPSPALPDAALPALARGGLDPSLPAPDWLEPTPRPYPVRNGYMKVPVNKASDFVGEKVMVTGNDGLEYQGTLAEAAGGTLVLEKYLRSGTFAVVLPARDVRKVEVAVR